MPERRVAMAGDLHRMLVIHDWQKLIHWQHLPKGIRSNKLLCSLQRDGVAQRPVGVVSFNQIYNIGHRFLWLFDLHSFPADVTVREWGRGEMFQLGIRILTMRRIEHTFSWKRYFKARTLVSCANLYYHRELSVGIHYCYWSSWSQFPSSVHQHPNYSALVVCL